MRLRYEELLLLRAYMAKTSFFFKINNNDIPWSIEIDFNYSVLKLHINTIQMDIQTLG